MLILQLSAAHGPNECQVAVQHALKTLCKEAEALKIKVSIMEENPSPNGLWSAIVSLDGPQEEILAQQWVGTIQWTCTSPLRPTYPRKNWFIGVQRLAMPAQLPADDSIIYQACKSSGPGGQHVNATSSAIHAKHLASGISVKVQTERSQFANKRLAKELIAIKLQELSQQQSSKTKQDANTLHWQVERGNPVRVFKGPAFKD